MKGLIAYHDGTALLEAEFFKESNALFTARKGGAIWEADKAIAGEAFLFEDPLFGRKGQLRGEIHGIQINTTLAPSLIYSQISFPEGKKVYGLRKQLPLELTDSKEWFRFILDEQSRNGPSLCLYLPKRYYLSQQEKSE